MKRIRIASALLALAVLAALAIVTTTSKHTVRAVYASTGCTDATLTGNYAVSGPGFTNTNKTANGNEVPFTAVGVFTFDGAGNISTTFTLSTNGAIQVGDTSSGTYSVNQDCTGSISFTSGNAAGISENMVIIGGGTEIFAINTTPGVTETLDVKHQ
jgi:hypothetical protein